MIQRDHPDPNPLPQAGEGVVAAVPPSALYSGERVGVRGPAVTAFTKILVANRGDQPTPVGAAAQPHRVARAAWAGDFAAGDGGV